MCEVVPVDGNGSEPQRGWRSCEPPRDGDRDGLIAVGAFANADMVLPRGAAVTLYGVFCVRRTYPSVNTKHGSTHLEICVDRLHLQSLG